MLSNTDVRAEVRSWTQPLPETPEQVFQTIWPELGAAVLNVPNAMLVATLRHGQFMVWEVRGRIPGTVDDLVRCMVDYSEAVAVVVVHPLPIPHGVQADEALSFTCEVATGRRPYVVSIRHGADEVAHEIGTLSDPDRAARWIGVPPGGGVVLWEMGPDQLYGPTAEA